MNLPTIANPSVGALVPYRKISTFFFGAGQDFNDDVDHDHGILVVVVVLEAGHGDDSLSVFSILANHKSGFGTFSKVSTLKTEAISKASWADASQVGMTSNPVIS